MKKSELQQIIKEEIGKALNENQSKKRGFLGIFNPGKDQFQRVIKKVGPDTIGNLSDYTKSNGDEVENQGSSVWASTKDSQGDNQMVWYYNGKDLLFTNPNHPSIYDSYIRKIN